MKLKFIFINSVKTCYILWTSQMRYCPKTLLGLCQQALYKSNQLICGQPWLWLKETQNIYITKQETSRGRPEPWSIVQICKLTAWFQICLADNAAVLKPTFPYIPLVVWLNPKFKTHLKLYIRPVPYDPDHYTAYYWQIRINL